MFAPSAGLLYASQVTPYRVHVVARYVPTKNYRSPWRSYNNAEFIARYSFTLLVCSGGDIADPLSSHTFNMRSNPAFKVAIARFIRTVNPSYSRTVKLVGVSVESWTALDIYRRTADGRSIHASREEFEQNMQGRFPPTSGHKYAFGQWLEVYQPLASEPERLFVRVARGGYSAPGYQYVSAADGWALPPINDEEHVVLHEQIAPRDRYDGGSPVSSWRALTHAPLPEWLTLEQASFGVKYLADVVGLPSTNLSKAEDAL